MTTLKEGLCVPDQTNKYENQRWKRFFKIWTRSTQLQELALKCQYNFHSKTCKSFLSLENTLQIFIFYACLQDLQNVWLGGQVLKALPVRKKNALPISPGFIARKKNDKFGEWLFFPWLDANKGISPASWPFFKKIGKRQKRYDKKSDCEILFFPRYTSEKGFFMPVVFQFGNNTLFALISFT